MAEEVERSDEVDCLQAGRLLDALVAERVMNWRWFYFKHDGKRHLIPPEHWQRYEPGQRNAHPVETCADDPGPRVPAFSVSIEAAWRIVENFRTGWLHKKAAACVDLHISDVIDADDCVCTIYAPDIVEIKAFAPEMPLAICRAALKVWEWDTQWEATHA